MQSPSPQPELSHAAKAAAGQLLNGYRPDWPPMQLQAAEEQDLPFMQRAYALAEQAAGCGEVPVGAVLVQAGRIIAESFNQVEMRGDAMAHAELLVLRQAQKLLGDWRLNDCQLYVTKEPCVMCAGVIVHCRLGRVVYGMRDAKSGGAGGWINLLQANPPLNHQCRLTVGVMEDECSKLVGDFFRAARAAAKARRKADKSC